MHLRKYCILFVCILSSSSVAYADAHAHTAPSLFREGQKEAKAGHTKEALELFLRSQKLEPSSRTIFNIADCEEKLGRVLSALARYEGLLASNKRTWKYWQIVNEKITALRARVAHLTIELPSPTPPGVTIKVDDRIVPFDGARTSIEVDPGEHTIVISANGVIGDTFVVAAQAGQTHPVRPIVLRPIATTKKSKRVGPVSRTNWPGTLTAAGSVVLGVGATLIASGRDARNEGEKVFDAGATPAKYGITNSAESVHGKQLADAGESEFNLGFALASVGLATALVGGGWWIVQSKRAPRAPLHASARITKSTGELSLSYEF